MAGLDLPWRCPVAMAVPCSEPWRTGTPQSALGPAIVGGPATNLQSWPAARLEARPVSAFQAFSQEQRPLLTGPFASGETMKVLSQRWKELSKTEKANYKVNGVEQRNIAHSPYYAFCQAQRPLLPPGLRNAQREAALGKLWAGLSEMEKAKYAPVTAAPVPAQALPTASWSNHRSAPPAPEEDSSRGKRAKTAARESPSAALTTAPLSAQPPASAPPMWVTVATAVEGWEAATAAATAVAGWATPYVPASSPTASLVSTSTSTSTDSTSTSTDTNNLWEEVLEEVLGPDGLFNSLEALLEDALEVCGRRLAACFRS